MEQTKDSIVSVRGKEEGIQPRDINAFASPSYTQYH